MPITPIGKPTSSLLCANCKTIAQQLSKSLFYSCEHEDPPLPGHYERYAAKLTICLNCNEETIWYKDKIIFPLGGNDIDVPNTELPSEIQYDYNEAASIVDTSPRGAIALLRLCIEKLCNHVLNIDSEDEIKKGINSAIDELVTRQLISDEIQKSLDIVRVTGNEAVHLGTMNLKDSVMTAKSLFVLVNDCSHHMISRCKSIEEHYLTLPEHKRKDIDDRNKRSISRQKTHR